MGDRVNIIGFFSLETDVTKHGPNAHNTLIVTAAFGGAYVFGVIAGEFLGTRFLKASLEKGIPMSICLIFSVLLRAFFLG